MGCLNQLKAEMKSFDYSKRVSIYPYLMYGGYRQHYDDHVLLAKAYAIKNLFEAHEKFIYENDLIVGSFVGNHGFEEDYPEMDHAKHVTEEYVRCDCIPNSDHFAPDYPTVLSEGIDGVKRRIRQSMKVHEKDADAAKKLLFLQAAEITMEGFSHMVTQYGEAAYAKVSGLLGEKREHLLDAARICRKIATKRPETFKEALQLVWLIHVSFLYEERYAMALGRMDQYLYPFFEKDLAEGRLTKEEALDLLSCTLYKISERTLLRGSLFRSKDDVVNIAVGGVKSDGSDATNLLSSLIVEAVKRCKIPGPNLSARIHKNTPDWFWDQCLEMIGTGIGYPAMMNDEINIAALQKCGYSLEDSRNYCMVGCIENFIPGKQPPWTDGRFNTPKYIEFTLNNGRCLQTGKMLGIETGDPSSFTTMDQFLEALVKQIKFGAGEYIAMLQTGTIRYNPQLYSQPYLSCYCQDCIGRGLDINDGGTIYPSSHGPCCMGIGTFSDSMAAIEKVVYEDKVCSLAELRDILAVDFEGYEHIRKQLIAAPKYGNNDEFADKYARWFMDTCSEIFSKYRTRDGGPMMLAMAANTSNIPAGRETAATPDGRKCGQPISDAASPMFGRDRNGVTAVLNSVSKPDYTKSACGTVLNQKFSPSVFATEEKRNKLKALLKVYFQQGGQEVQINSVSRDILLDARKHPENYADLVVRVSGFSAHYTKISPEAQEDILRRTEHE